MSDNESDELLLFLAIAELGLAKTWRECWLSPPDATITKPKRRKRKRGENK